MNKDRDDFNEEKNEINIDSTKEMSINSNNLNAKQIIDDMIDNRRKNK